MPRSDQDRIADILESSARIAWAAMAALLRSAAGNDAWSVRALLERRSRFARPSGHAGPRTSQSGGVPKRPSRSAKPASTLFGMWVLCQCLRCPDELSTPSSAPCTTTRSAGANGALRTGVSRLRRAWNAEAPLRTTQGVSLGIVRATRASRRLADDFFIEALSLSSRTTSPKR